MLLTLVAALVTAATMAAHALTAFLAWRRCRSRIECVAAGHAAPPVSIVRPVHGLENAEKATLASTFALAYPRYEVIFCAERESDPAVAYLRGLIAAHPHRRARLLIGNAMRSRNPKLDNIEKGWAAALHPWVILADANVAMPVDYIQRLLGAWRENTGLVSAPPIGAAPGSFWAEVECAFLNTYQARWQYAADSIGYGFAQGKNLLWRKADLEAIGGIRTLALEVAEDAAATKLVRRQGRRVRLVDRPFEQPLGRRTWPQVWNRQLRWAQLRRQSFPWQFALEILTTVLVPSISGGLAAVLLGLPLPVVCVGTVALWLGVEALLSRAVGWHLSWWSPLAWLTRDVLIVALWTAAWFRRDYEWHGSRVSIGSHPASPAAALDRGPAEHCASRETSQAAQV